MHEDVWFLEMMTQVCRHNHRLHFQGCKVIGYAGTDDKVKWLKDELGFDFAFNYKKVDLSKSIKQVAPDGVDVYFDNVRPIELTILALF